MTPKQLFFEKFREATASVLPITLIVAALCFTVVPVTPDLMLSFLIGAVLLIVCTGLNVIALLRSKKKGNCETC